MSSVALHPLIARSLALKLVIMLRHSNGTRPAPELLEQHLQWMIDQERCGNILLSGPVARGEGSLMGVTVFRTQSTMTADELARSDPFVIAQLVQYELHEWTAYEGSISVKLCVSTGSATLA